MNLIDRVGTFRGLPVSTGIGASSGGYPQFLAKFEAVEKWDEELQEWIDWSEYAQELTGYFILFGKSGDPTRNCNQLMKALGWDGRSLDDLNNTDYSEVVVQIRVEEHTYNGTTKLQIAWLDHTDAAPGRSVEKMDASGVKKLQAKYAAGLKKLGGGPVISKPTTKPTAAPKATAKAKVTGPKSGKKKAKATAPPPPAVSAAELEAEAAPEAGPDATSGEIITKDEAWAAVSNSPATEGLSDVEVSALVDPLWTASIEMMGGEETFDDEDWARLRGVVIGQLEEKVAVE